MNNINIKSLIKDWYISYNSYADLFQIYDDRVFKIPTQNLLEKKQDKVRLIINQESSLPILLEIKDAYDTLGVNINDLEKSDIINLVTPYFRKYVKE